MRVLVTGAGGFVGSHLVRKLSNEGHQVFALVRREAANNRLGAWPSGVRLLAQDLADGDALQRGVSEIRPDCAIHLAWYAVPGKYLSAGENLECVSMTLTLARALQAAGCRRFIGVGSCFEYDLDYGFLSERVTPLKPRTLYAAAKDATRQILEAYCKQALMEFAWCRLFYLYGPGEAEQRLVPSVALALLSGETTRVTEGAQIRDYLHVEDVASAIVAVAQSDLTGPVNIASGEPVRVREIVCGIAKVIGNPEQVMFGAVPMRPDEPPVILADVRRLFDGPCWRPSISLDDGLQRTVEWWRDVEDERRIS